MLMADNMTMRRIRRIHFVGIGGSGMGGIAEVLANLGYKVSGSDLCENAVTRRLTGLGVSVTTGHNPANVKKANVVVISSAIAADNTELVAARQLRIPIVPRAEMLAELMRFRYGIAIAGTHGKTTTTSLVASLLAVGGLDPTFVVGGRLNSTNSHSKLGAGRYLVAEADESDASFLYLQPMIAVATNLDADHLGSYEGQFQKLRATFIEFLHHLPFYGLAVICIDDMHLRGLLSELGRPVITYGIEYEADIQAFEIVYSGPRCYFRVSLPQYKSSLQVTLNMPGRHNVLNALAAISVAAELGVSDKAILKGLEEFQGIARRFQYYGEINLPKGIVSLVDDYGHHPSEIRAIFDAVRHVWPGRRLVVAFQPHRYTRTRDLFDDFTSVLNDADVLVMTEVYAANEDPILNADGRALCRALRNRSKLDPVFVEDLQGLPEVLSDLLHQNDILLTLGAGSIGTVAAQLAREFGVSEGQLR
jgi:UDP-N-acetylmuramate--alanine ligase